MEVSYNQHSKKSGIYKITCRANGSFYIGSCKEFKRRLRGHLSSLRRGTHHSKKMQNCFNKHGEDSFVFEVLEVMEASTELQRQQKEQEYLDALWCSGILNIRKKADRASYEPSRSLTFKENCRLRALTNPNMIASRFKAGHPGHKGEKNPMYGRPSPTRGKSLTQEHRQKIGLANRARMKEKWQTPEYVHGMREAHLGKHSSPRTEFKQGEVRHYLHVKDILLCSPTGEVFYEVVNVKQFALAHGLYAARLSLLLKGKLKQYKGWTCVKAFCAEVGVPYQVNDINWIIRKSADPE